MSSLLLDPLIVFGIGSIIAAAAGAFMKWVIIPGLKADLEAPVAALEAKLTLILEERHRESITMIGDASRRETVDVAAINEQLGDLRERMRKNA